MPDTSELSWPDPLRISVDLPLRVTHYPLGYPVEIATNSLEVLAAAKLSWRRFRQRFPEPKLTLRIAVEAVPSRERPPLPEFRGQKHLLAAVADAKNFAVCDFERGFGFAWLDSGAARHRDYVNYFFIEALAYTFLAHRCLTPVHAACVARDGRAVLLCGSSGAGKTSLSYACARAGWTYLSDNETWLTRQPGDRTVLANPHQVRFRESAADLFPELEKRRAAKHLSGKLSIVVATAKMPQIQTAFQGRAEYLVFLNRNAPGRPSLAPVPPDEALQRLRAELPAFEKRVEKEQAISLQNLIEAPAYELRYRTLASALRLLERLISE